MIVDKEEFIRFLMSIPGIGRAKAEAIYESGFDTKEKLINASIEDLVRIKGISENLAKRIKEEVGKEAEKEEEKEEKEEEKRGVPRIKPKLDEKLKEALEKRREKKDREPEFLRQEWFRYKRLGECWRRPKGLH
ncbi:MAG: 50S ribosomal protein L32e, partial [Thermoplasmata archaeon]